MRRNLIYTILSGAVLAVVMAKLFMKVIDKEKADNTYRHHNLRRGRWAEGREKAGIE